MDDKEISTKYNIHNKYTQCMLVCTNKLDTVTPYRCKCVYTLHIGGHVHSFTHGYQCELIRIWVCAWERERERRESISAELSKTGLTCKTLGKFSLWASCVAMVDFPTHAVPQTRITNGTLWWWNLIGNWKEKFTSKYNAATHSF